MKEPLDAAAVIRLLGGETDPERARTWLLHHLEGCPTCRERLLEQLGLGSLEEFAALAEDGVAVQEQWQRAQAERTLEAIGELSIEKLRTTLAADPALQTPGMAETLLERCRGLWGEDARAALVWAECASEICEARLKAEPWNSFAADAAARAWAYVGNCRRIQGDHRGADRAFFEAQDRLERGTEELEVRAEVLDLEASLRRDQRRFEEARSLLEGAIAAYGDSRRPELAGKALLKLVGNLQAAERTAEAASLVDQALEALSRKSGRWYAMALATKGQLEYELGHQEEARRLMPEIRAMLKQHGGELDRLRWRWFEARVLGAEHGEEWAAEEELQQIYQAFVDREMGYDAALVCLDRAIVYARLGQTSDIKRLALEMTPVFLDRDIHREAMAALLLFRYAAQEEILTLHYVHALRSYLEAARHRPELAFQPPPSEERT